MSDRFICFKKYNVIYNINQVTRIKWNCSENLLSFHFLNGEVIDQIACQDCEKFITDYLLGFLYKDQLEVHEDIDGKFFDVCRAIYSLDCGCKMIKINEEERRKNESQDGNTAKW